MPAPRHATSARAGEYSDSFSTASRRTARGRSTRKTRSASAVPSRRAAADPPTDADRRRNRQLDAAALRCRDRKSTRLNSSHTVISYAVFCLKKKKKQFSPSSFTKKKTKITTK